MGGGRAGTRAGDEAGDRSGASPLPPSADGDEFAAIRRLRAVFEAAAGGGAPEGEVWIGDDAAAVRAGRGPLLLATDLVVAGVHADLRWCSPADAGFKAVMATVSDIAAMGGRPRHLLVSVAAPPSVPLDAVVEGVAEAARLVGAPVVGGDLSAAPVLVVSVAVTGSLEAGPQPGGEAAPLLRSGARPGDTVLVTGALGASAAGLARLRDRVLAGVSTLDTLADDGSEALAAAHRRPVARLDEGDAARQAGARAAVDVSDGLLADVGHLAEASGVGVALSGIPVAPGATLADALGGGEDYELVVATPEPRQLEAVFAASGLRPPVRIGVCTAESGVVRLDGELAPAAGWRHSLG
ncbi:MAG: thiamine-phosphate kinase [Actinomycetota bacterium]|nr:thiamine-phosphate kinase [Actinomycetota bacterium]